MKDFYLSKSVGKVFLVLLTMILGHGSMAQDLVINEYLAWPAGGTSDDPVVDANGDGSAHFSGDEFIEFVNSGVDSLDISGWTISDIISTPTVRHVFPEGSKIAPGGALIVFGATPSPDRLFGGAIVQTASVQSSGLGMTNTGDTIVIVNPAEEDTVIELIYGAQIRGTSVTRSPDITGDYASHPILDTLTISPGTKLDGSLFLPLDLVINEFLAWPAGSTSDDPAVDANGDGNISFSEDEFIEFVNNGSETIDISGWKIQDIKNTPTVRHIFPEGSTIASGAALVVFGGGTPTGSFGRATVQVASEGLSGLGMTNGADSIIILSPADEPLIVLAYEAQVRGTSMTRDPDITGDYTSHPLLDTVHFSPGTKLDGEAFIPLPIVLNEYMAWPAGSTSSDPEVDANGDGNISFSEDEFIEFVNTGDEVFDLSGWKIMDIKNTPTVRHIFPEGSEVGPGAAIVVFGGGTPTGSFGGAVVQTASEQSSGLGMTNGADSILLLNEFDETMILLIYETQIRGTSETRNPDITGDYGSHPVLGSNNFSPGTKLNGDPFVPLPLVINEVMAWPAGGTSDDPAVDTNGDGLMEFGRDEFIEFINEGLVDIDISGWKILDVYTSPTVRHIFPEGTIIAPGAALVVFGGGTPTGAFGGATVQVASESTEVTSGLGLTNSGDTILIKTAGDETMLQFIYGAQVRGKSITRNPDITGEFSEHPLLDPNYFSPGLKVDGSVFVEIPTTLIDLATATVTASEGDGTIAIDITITQPSNSTATTVDLVLIEGSATDIGDYTTQSLTFAAGSSDPQTVTITITDDDQVEATDTIRFELQNIAGGQDAVLGTNTVFTLVLSDNDFATSSLIINEFLAWPAGSASSAGDSPEVDANGDGGIDFAEDEFIEFVNNGNVDIDISGWKIYDEYTQVLLRHVFPAGTVINPGGALLVFGGGNPTGDFGGTPWQLASEGLNGLLGLTNTEDAITVTNANDETVIYYSYGQQTRATSITLDPDITGALGPHPDLNGRNISPGTKIDGSPFEIPTSTQVSFASPSGGALESEAGSYEIALSIVRPSETAETTADVIITSSGFANDLSYTTQKVTFPAGSSDNQTVTVSIIADDEKEGDELYLFALANVSGGTSAIAGSVSTFELLITDDDVPLLFNEIHADPASSVAGDANGDGTFDDGTTDEFIEVVNNSEETVDMSGWSFYDATSLRHTFPSGTVIVPGAAVVVFGGGIPVGTFGYSNVQLSDFGLDLDDSGDTLSILDSEGGLAAKTVYGKLANDNQSITRDPDIVGGYVKHSSVVAANGALWSPGTMNTGEVFVLSNFLKESMIRIYPNPASRFVTVSAEGVSSDLQVNIYSLSGSRVLNHVVSKGTKAEIDLSGIEQGVYLYEIKTNSLKALDKGKIIINK